MVIVGGSGTLIGPIIGAAFFLILEHQLSTYTEAWALFLGLVFIAVVLFAPEGIWGLATSGSDAHAPVAGRKAPAMAKPGGCPRAIPAHPRVHCWRSTA